MTTDEMIEALSRSNNKLVSEICQEIIAGRETIENRKTFCGKFLQFVFEGKHLDAFRIADRHNKAALMLWLIEQGRHTEVDTLIHETYFSRVD